MKRVALKTLATITILAGVTIGTNAEASASQSIVRAAVTHTGVTTKTDTIPVPDMQCGMCESKISKKLKTLKGISSIAADAEAKQVIVTYDAKKVKLSAIEKAIAEAGYDAGRAVATAGAKEALPMCCRPGGAEE